METTTAAVLFAMAFAPAVAFGLWFRRSQRIEWLSGIDAARVVDRGRLARFVGTAFVAIGGIGIGAGAIMASAPPALFAPIALAAVIAVNIVVVALALGVRRLSKASA
ncbi:MAG TPA: hypothetical protein VFS55_09040 [Dokdonella sp.]|nr:hypothetical protein [Dokdonella sp.]